MKARKYVPGLSKICGLYGGRVLEPVRLNKYLSDKGICSRREADRLTGLGVILVNGKTAMMGQKVTDADQITVEGRPVNTAAPEKVIIAVNKPVGVVCTTRAFKGEQNILDLVNRPERLYPVGRLDKDSEGLIFLTNDGAFTAELTKASGQHEKEYEVTLDKEPTDEFIRRLEKGVYLRELQKTTAPCRIRRAGEKKLKIILIQGLNRQIRRMCQSLGYDVRSLKRVRIMNVLLGDLKPGEYREIRGDEKRMLTAELRGKRKK